MSKELVVAPKTSAKPKALKPKKFGKSLTFVNFKISLQNEIRLFWHTLASQEFSRRWLLAIPTPPAQLSKYPGDNCNPFKSIDLSVPDFLSHTAAASAAIRENSVVSFITAFEFYLFEMLERLIYIEPSLIDDSSMPIEAKELITIKGDNLRQWLATKIADKYLRNKSHAEMILKIDKFTKAGVSSSLKNEITEWHKWSLVRNAVVHTSRFATLDLTQAWPDRFKTVGEPLNLTDKDVARVHHLALTISVAIDKRAVETIVKKMDARLLVRELFVQNGQQDPRRIRLLLNHILQTPIPVVEIEKILADQRKGKSEDSWSLSHGDLLKIMNGYSP